jgi:hypothetical protein
MRGAVSASKNARGRENCEVQEVVCVTITALFVYAAPRCSSTQFDPVREHTLMFLLASGAHPRGRCAGHRSAFNA